MTTSRPVLTQINIVSGNPRASLDFYRRLGVDFPEDRVWRTATAAHHASANRDGEIDFDLDSPEFAAIWNRGWANETTIAARVVVGFRVASREDVDLCFASMIGAGYRGLQGPYDAFWGARYAIIEDPDGVAVGLMSPVDPARRSKLPEV